MRYLVILVITLACSVLTCARGRPLKVEERDDSEVEEVDYEMGGDGPDDSAVHEIDGPMSNEQQEQEQVADANLEEEEAQSETGPQSANDNPVPLRATDDERPAENHFKFSDYKTGRKSESPDKPDPALDTSSQYETQPKRNLSPVREDTPNEKSDEDQRIVNRDLNELTRNDENNKRALNSRTTPMESRLLFEMPNKNDKHAYNGVPPEANEHNEQPRYFKQYYNEKMSAENKGHKFHRFHLNRDRRNAEPGCQKPELGDVNAEDEEEAIKRHVKKLSNDELQELLNSLSEDKRELLKKIMGGDILDKENINKREITKKDSSLQENSNIDSGLVDLSKLQEGGSIDTLSGSSSSSSTPRSKTPELNQVNELSVTKTSETPKGSPSSEASNNNDSPTQASELNNVNDASAMNTDINTSNNQAVAYANPDTKLAIKREANFDSDLNEETGVLENDAEIGNFEGSENQDDFSSQDEDFSQLMKDESQLHGENRDMFKREAYERSGDFSDSIRSLEESFPKPNTYDESDPYSGTDLAPLVRVKRKNTDCILKKRSAANPEAKVAYFPYRAENEDEDNDEGSEFDDDGFFDRNSNLAPNADDRSMNEGSPVQQPESANSHARSNKKLSRSKNSDAYSENENIEGDMSLGSDTDSVLSGVEGVDENVMVSSSSRNRRNSKKNPNTARIENCESNSRRDQRSTPYMVDDMKTATENLINVPNLSVESDAFGALPRSYDGELGRYKRVRRVKQQQDVSADK